MYMGHFGIALGARRWLRPLPLVWLLFASIAPDLYDALAGLMPALDTGGISHTLPGAVGAAISFALATALICRNGALALGVGLLALSHTATDYLTSRMPVWPGGLEHRTASLCDAVGRFPAGERRDHHRVAAVRPLA